MLEHWAPQPEDAPFSIKMQNLYHSHPHWRPTLDSRGYPKAGTGDPNAPYVLFSSTDCQELLGFLARCLRTAVHHAQNNNLDLLIANLRMVHEIVQETAIESLFTKTSLRRVLQGTYLIFLDTEENHPAVEQFTSRDDGSVEPLEQNYDEDEDERQEIESIEEVDTSRDLASPLRYIRSTTAWCAAIDYFFKPSAPVDMGTFELLIVKRAKLAAKETREEAYKFLRHRLETLRSNEYLERVLSQLEKKFERINIPFTGYVHAEAGLMVYCRNRDPPATLSIGVSKKCCYLCFRLIQRLREHSGGGLWVPGTHGTIYGWSPPPLPIPTDVLRKLEDDLIDVLWMDAEENFSRQNSPATPDKSFRMDFPIADLTVIEY
ncbi:hypothetical protein DL96DRAFT_1549631 [Flagelloscypha sp. PMI_526]|nr:hypothetical protein DL96DRAFT_1549631 [Flagelloscypha sp. PMI_526]